MNYTNLEIMLALHELLKFVHEIMKNNFRREPLAAFEAKTPSLRLAGISSTDAISHLPHRSMENPR